MADDLLALVRRTAALARLEVAPEEGARLAREFERILDAFRSLAEGPEGARNAQGTPPGPEPEPRMRADLPDPFPHPERLFRAAPEPHFGPTGTLLGVPKTVGDDA